MHRELLDLDPGDQCCAEAHGESARKTVDSYQIVWRRMSLFTFDLLSELVLGRRGQLMLVVPVASARSDQDAVSVCTDTSPLPGMDDGESPGEKGGP